MMTNDKAGAKYRLERTQDRLSSWLRAFTALVVVGLVVEYLPDIIHALRTRTFPVNISGAILITIGVGGELVIEFLSSRAETKLREMNDSIIADAMTRVAELNRASGWPCTDDTGGHPREATECTWRVIMAKQIEVLGQKIARGNKMTGGTGWRLVVEKRGHKTRAFIGTLLTTFNFGKRRLAVFTVPND
jgi:hypothetical protein